MIRIAYLNETITISDQRITDTMPMMVSGEIAPAASAACLNRIERARADIAVDDAERRESCRSGHLAGFNPGQRRRLKGSGHFCVLPNLRKFEPKLPAKETSACRASDDSYGRFVPVLVQ